MTTPKVFEAYCTSVSGEIIRETIPDNYYFEFTPAGDYPYIKMLKFKTVSDACRVLDFEIY